MDQFTIDRIDGPVTITLPTIDPHVPQRFGITVKDHDTAIIDGKVRRLPLVVAPVQIGKNAWEWWIAEGADDDLAGFEPLAR